MSLSFFEDVVVDHGALAHLQDVALMAAVALQEASQRRPQIAAVNLARCAGPFADDLADHVIRLAANQRELGEALLALAATAATASVDARSEQARREQFRMDYHEARAAEVLAEAAKAAAMAGVTAAVTGTASGDVRGAAGTTAPLAPVVAAGWNPGAPL